MPSQSKKLEKILKENIPIEQEGRTINEELFDKIRQELVKWGGEEFSDYNPVVEMAKIANSPTVDETLKYRANSEIASYMYPKVRSLEIKQKTDSTVNVNIKIADYAQKNDMEIVPEELGFEEGDEEDMQPGQDYSNFIVRKPNEKLNS